MFLFEEKRKQPDRRIRNEGPPAGCRERRVQEDRRQTDIAEITLHEWTRQFLKYQQHAVTKAHAGHSANAANALAKSRA